MKNSTVWAACTVLYCLPCLLHAVIRRERRLLLLLCAACCVAAHVSNAQEMRSFRFPAGITSGDYLENVVVVRLKSQPQNTGARIAPAAAAAGIHKIQQAVGARQIQQVFPATALPVGKQARLSQQEHSLSHIYQLQLPPNTDLQQAINELLRLEEVVYAEPYYLMKPLGVHRNMMSGYIPSDPEAKPGSKQDYLAVVRAYEAWEIEKGSMNIKIGMLDTGVGLGHQDLMDNLYHNTADPLNGKDDDNDGYVDNYLGWDMADGDSDPTADRDQHGTMVAGIAAASTDNGKGIAGAGFNAAYMPVKIFRSSNGYFSRGYEAIAYAADRGCQVINLSWGAPNAYSSFAQDVINYAVLEKDVVIVAAAGNSGKQENYYPASYEHVLSVAVSDTKDNRTAQTTYNYMVDVMAPGSNSYTTANEDQYQYASGSSLSAPLVAGAAALVRAKYPELSALQVMEKIRLSSDNIYSIGANSSYQEKLGRGRLNMKRALQPLNSPAVRMVSMQYQNHMGAYAFPGDTLRIKAHFTNYFKATTARAMVRLSTSSPYVTLLDSLFQLGAMDSLQSMTNEDREFRLYLHKDLPVNEKLVFRLGFEDDKYDDYQYFTIHSSPDHVVVNNGKMSLDIGSNGNMAYNPHELFGGMGLLFQQTSLATQMGLIIAADSSRVSDNVINSFKHGNRSGDFMTQDPLRLSISEAGGLQTFSSFSDTYALQPLDIRVEQTWFSDTVATQQDYLLAQYRVIALADTPLPALHTAVFANWDLEDPEANKAVWDEDGQLGYVYAENLYAGVALLSSQTPAYHAIDLKDSNGNTAELGKTFSDTERYQLLTKQKAEAGARGAGNDVAFMVGGKADTVRQYETVTFAFALLAGNSLEQLQQALQKAREKYHEHLLHPVLSHTIQLCRDSSATLSPEGNLFRFYRDPLGKELLHEGTFFQTGAIGQDTAFFFTCIDQGYESSISRIDIRVLEPLAEFSFKQQSNHGIIHDTLFLDESENYVVEMTNLSSHAVRWEWDMGNGFKSSQKHPKTLYRTPGQYTLSLKAYSAPGCVDIFSRALTVVQRAPMPSFREQLLCAGTAASIQADNTESVAFYADAGLQKLLFQGSALVTDPVWRDTVFYAVNTEATYESLPRQVRVRVVSPELQIAYSLDTLHLYPRYALNVRAVGDTSGVLSYRWYVDGQPSGEEDTLYYDFSSRQQEGEAFTLRLDYAVEKEGVLCNYSSSTTIRPAAGDKPSFAIQYICQDRQAEVMPVSGSVFYYYQDVALDSLVYKGKGFQVDSLESARTYYVTCMDGLKESEAVAVTVNINRFADFSMSEDTLSLMEGSRVELQAYTLDETDPSRVSWNWDMGSGSFVSRSSTFTHQFDSAGIYRIRLQAHTADGCVNTIEKKLVVQTVAGTETEMINQALRLYPNPSAGRFTLENQHWLYEKLNIHLLSLQGDVLYSRNYTYAHAPLTIDLTAALQSRPAGLYLVQIENAYSSFFRKILYVPAAP